MPPCSICLDELKSPVSLPCGHLFCSECLIRAVNAIVPLSTIHYCPTCRSQYFTVNIDPNTLPVHLRPYIVPSVRKIYIEESSPSPSPSLPTESPTRPEAGPSSTLPSDAEIECRRLKAENEALRVNIALWRKRAEVHAGATLGLLSMARASRDYAVGLKQQHDAMGRELLLLRKNLSAETETGNDINAHAHAISDFNVSASASDSLAPTDIPYRSYAPLPNTSKKVSSCPTWPCMISEPSSFTLANPTVKTQLASRSRRPLPSDTDTSHSGPPTKKQRRGIADLPAASSGSTSIHTDQSHTIGENGIWMRGFKDREPLIPVHSYLRRRSPRSFMSELPRTQC